MRNGLTLLAFVLLGLTGGGCASDGGDRAGTGGRKASASEWRSLPLVKDNAVDPAWDHTGYGRFVVDDGAIRTEPDEKGLGLLVYTKEKYGDCQIRVVYRAKDERSNSGVYVRIDDGILKRLDEDPPAAKRGPDGQLTVEGSKAMEEASDKEAGPWYAVHHGYEVQIADGGDEFHRTGAIYSYAKAAAAPEKPRDQWRTMLITLRGTQIEVDLDGKRVTEFDSTSKDVPPRRQWHEPRREHPRPTRGYFGLQTHDPGDTVWFKEVSVRRLSDEQ